MVDLTGILSGGPQTYFTKMAPSFRRRLTENGGSSSETVLCINPDLDPAPEGNGLLTGSRVLPGISPQYSPRVGDSPAGSANFLSLALSQLRSEQGSPTAAAVTLWLALSLLAAWLGKRPPSLLHLPTTCSLRSRSSTSEGQPPSRASRGTRYSTHIRPLSQEEAPESNVRHV